MSARTDLAAPFPYFGGKRWLSPACLGDDLFTLDTDSEAVS